ncbi:unnamed protein product [Arabidopsis halleri]
MLLKPASYLLHADSGLQGYNGHFISYQNPILIFMQRVSIYGGLLRQQVSWVVTKQNFLSLCFFPLNSLSLYFSLSVACCEITITLCIAFCKFFFYLHVNNSTIVTFEVDWNIFICHQHVFL